MAISVRNAPTVRENAAYRLLLSVSGGRVFARLDDKRSGLRVADGPMVFRTDAAGHDKLRTLSQIKGARVEASSDSLTIRGQLGGVEFVQVFRLPKAKAIMEETVALVNHSRRLVNLPDIECGFIRVITDTQGQVQSDVSTDRWVAVPLRVRADDPPGYAHDFSAHDLATTPGSEPDIVAMAEGPQWAHARPSRHRWSEGWAWTHGAYTLGVFKFCQANMVFSVLSVAPTAQGTALRFGGACRITGEPSAIHRIKPGETVDLGLNRYETTHSDYMGAMYAFRRFLDEKGCRFPATYNPPIHWEQLYDMPGAWDDRAKNYTKAIVEKEAEKGVAYSCEALYLDPGWDTALASFIWGPWLGKRSEFVKEMKSKYGLAVSLHCPLASWMSCSTLMGPSAVSTYPAAAKIAFPPDEAAGAAVPAVRDGRRNVALEPGARALASSTIPGYALHTPAHLNDGWFGNSQSWIPASLPAWAEIDLAGPRTISSVRVGNDHLGEFTDRSATSMKVMVASGSEWRQVAEYEGPGLGTEHEFTFPPVEARKVRVVILQGSDPKMLPRLDEIEIYEDRGAPAGERRALERSVKRGPRVVGGLQATMCLGSRQYLDTAAKRMIENCADGVCFLMFDGNWWSGGCNDPNHGHPIPYTPADHFAANVELARRVHAKYPHVLIEMHDMLVGGSPVRLTPVYFKYGLPGSYDENWGFELMWDPMANIRSGQARALYYYNVGCHVPAYLHIDLRGDNRECVELWWYASTCRHLGIGGTNADPEVVAAEKAAMKRYKSLEAFYKRGEFYGLGEEIHVHVLGDKFVVNVFNISDKARQVSGSIALKELGLDPRRQYQSADGIGVVRNGRLEVDAELPAWGAKVGEFGG